MAMPVQMRKKRGRDVTAPAPTGKVPPLAPIQRSSSSAVSRIMSEVALRHRQSAVGSVMRRFQANFEIHRIVASACMASHQSSTRHATMPHAMPPPPIRFDSIYSAPPIPPVYPATSRYMVAAWYDPSNKASIYAASPFRYRRSSIRRRSSSPSQHTTLLLPTNAAAATRCCSDWERGA